MPVLDITINNDTTVWNAHRQGFHPAHAWNPDLPLQIDHQSNGRGVCTVPGGYNQAGFHYQSISHLGTTQLRLAIHEGHESTAQATSTDPNVRAACVVQKMGGDRWLFRVKWTVGS